MISVLIDYASPSLLDSTADSTVLGLTGNARRPVRFRGTVEKHLFELRTALRSLGEAIWSNDAWHSETVQLDPVITVHSDRIFFEAFSGDESAYVLLIVDPEVFRAEGLVQTGTTNVDFTAWLWGALGEMRGSRETTFSIGGGGLEVATAGAGGRTEKKVDLPDSWVRGFLQLQNAMAMPGTRVSVRPVDLLAAIRYMRFTKAKVSPRALRYEFAPDEEARIVLEPWERTFRLKGTRHNYTELRTIRTWGRRRLKLIEPLLPFAHQVDIYLKGRALPSFYAVKLPGMTFVLGLSGWTDNNWAGSAGMDLLSGTRDRQRQAAEALPILAGRVHLSEADLAREMGIERPLAYQLLVELCRTGRAIYDVESREFRHRELFEKPIDRNQLYPPDERVETAGELLTSDKVRVVSCQSTETRKIRKLKTPEGTMARQIIYRNWQVTGIAGEHVDVVITMNDSGAMIFGKCGCEFFRENLMNKGPCAHMLALHKASEDARRDQPASVAADATPPQSGMEARKSGDEREDGELDSEEEQDDKQ